MPVFTAVAAAVSAAVGGGIFGAVAGFAARTLLTIGITKLVANKAGRTAAGTSDAGSRVQLPPASNNKLPVSYGTAYLAPIITDAKISEDQKTMWYVCALAEVTGSNTYTFGDIYWAGKKVVFDGTDTAKVIRLETNSDPVQLDESVNGKIYIYKFPNGSASGISTGGTNAITLLSDSSIPANQRWNGPIYTDGGQSAQMANTAFLIVKVSYDANANTTRLEQMNVELTNSITKPGDVLLDYMINDRYGCALQFINSASFVSLNDYSDELVDYIPVGGGTATRPRYRINGPVNTGQNCLNNLQELVDACDSWLQYSELTGEWTVVVNRPYDWDGTTIAGLYQVTDSVLISGINVNPIDLNNAYNQLEVQFPDNQVNDQTNFKVINLIDFAPEVMSYNEPENKLTVQFPQVNSYLQSTYLGLRRMLQSREDLVIDLTLDYSGIQVQAGDVITVPYVPYGWEAFNSGYGKLFRVSQVQEAKLDDGSLGARITAFEYNSTVYADDPIQDFVESSNTGLTDPNIFDRPTTPIVLNGPIANGAINYFTVSSNVPTSGTTLYMDFNVGNSSNLQTHESYSSVQIGDGTPYSANSTVTINVADLNPGTYYWSATARNDIAGKQGNSSAGFVWGGPSVSNFDANTNVGGITFAQCGLDAGGAQIVTFYGVNNQRTSVVTPPVAANGTNTRNIPLIFTGTAPNVNYIWPYGQGTAVATFPPAGYGLNSTAPYYPVDAALIAIPKTYNNFDDYYKLISVNLASTTITTDEIFVNSAQFEFFTNTANTKIMITPYASFTVDPTLDFVQTQFASFHTLAEPFPHVHGISLNQVDNGEGTIEALGYFIKVLTTGANVTCINGSMAVKQQRPYTGSITF
jgi:hypothetical protein